MRTGLQRILTSAAVLLVLMTAVPAGASAPSPAPQATAATGSVTVQAVGAATVLARPVDPSLGPSIEKLTSSSGPVRLTGLVPGEAYVVSTRSGATASGPVTLVATSGAAVSLFTDAPGLARGRPRSVFGYASSGGVGQHASVAIQRVLPSGKAVGLTHVPTDPTGRFALSLTPTATTTLTLRAAVTLGGVLHTSSALTLTTGPSLSILRVSQRRGFTVISGVLSPGDRSSVITISTQGRGTRRLGRAAVQPIVGGRVRFSLTVPSAWVTSSTVLITVTGTSIRRVLPI